MVINFFLGYLNQTDRLPVTMLNFKMSANQSFFQVGNLECEFNSIVPSKVLSKKRVLKACQRIDELPTAKPKNTNPTLSQREEIMNWERRKKKKVFEFPRSTVKIHIIKPVVNVNFTFELPKISVKESKNEDGSKNDDDLKKDDGLKFTLSVYAVIVIAVATVIVVIVIAVVVIAKRCQRKRRRSTKEYESDDDFDTPKESTEMCTFFGSVARSERNRPVIEVHRHSIHCDTIEELPPAYRGMGNFTQPITTHIDLSYKSRKTGFGVFC